MTTYLTTIGTRISKRSLFHKLITGCGPVGRALDLGSRRREFESPHSDHKNRCFRLKTAVFSNYYCIFCRTIAIKCLLLGLDPKICFSLFIACQFLCEGIFHFILLKRILTYCKHFIFITKECLRQLIFRSILQAFRRLIHPMSHDTNLAHRPF